MASSIIRPLMLGLALLGLAGGFVARAAGLGDLDGRLPVAAETAIWAAGVVPILAVLVVEIVTSLARGDIGLDIVAALSMTAALATGEALAAAVVALMYAGGTYLESYAAGRARAEMQGLLARVPRSATRHRGGDPGAGVEEVPLARLSPGDLVLVRRGEVAPADGSVEAGQAVLDLSALTGEAMPVTLGTGEAVMSGATNLGEPFDLRLSHSAAESTYAGIVRLVEAAQKSRAPMARLADRYALGFLGLTLALAGGAWALTGDPVRAVAVLVVATPCPLILAVPVAMVAGLSRAARFGVLVKGAPALEAMAEIRAMVLDKTGTLTHGEPRLVAVEPAPGITGGELLRLAAALDQGSAHPVARRLVVEAEARGLDLPMPEGLAEVPGEGVTGRIGGVAVAVGGPGFVVARTADPPPAPAGRTPGSVTVAVACDGRWAGRLILSDRLRAGTDRLLARLRKLGLVRIVLATGDDPATAEAVAGGLALDGLRAGLTPDQKVLVVLSERRHGPVMMIGDGVNDAPALAAADLGVAMGARGTAASAEAAGVVLLVDRLDRILAGIEIARGTRRIALQSVMVGIGLSLAGMTAAAFGRITPVEGAVLQEAIDVAAILNALRVLALRPSISADSAAADPDAEEPDPVDPLAGDPLAGDALAGDPRQGAPRMRQGDAA